MLHQRNSLTHKTSKKIDGMKWKQTITLRSEILNGYDITSQEVSFRNEKTLHNKGGGYLKVNLEGE